LPVALPDCCSLQSVRWELVGVTIGETAKVGVALLLALVGYLCYRKEQ